MRYIVRAIKYFFYFWILLALIIVAMIILRYVPSDPELIFRNGYDSYWQISLMFGVLAAFYPMFGYTTKEISAPGEASEHRDRILAYMQDRGYILESENGGDMTFRLRNVFGKIMRMYEDRITIRKVLAGYTVEGSRKEVIRIGYGLEARLQNN